MAEESLLQKVLEYHQVTKHQFHAYARGPGYLDWANQPNPFRRYEGARLLSLEKIPLTDKPAYHEVVTSGHVVSPSPSDLKGISQLFYDSLALSAWKSTGDNQWSLRVNASSGNLHPTEGYLVCGPVEGLCKAPMVCHYTPMDHGLEVLAEFELSLWQDLCRQFPEHTFFIGLTSIHWREAWKYGQRAFRYCNHDIGHAIGALSIAAAGLGWQTRLLDNLATDDLGLLLGTFRYDDAEREVPDVLIACSPGLYMPSTGGLPREVIANFESLSWQGKPNPLSQAHVDWGMEEIVEATQKPRDAEEYKQFQCLPVDCSPGTGDASLRKVIRQRRSAVSMDGHTTISRENFYAMMCKTLAVTDAVPFNTLPWKPNVHLAIFVHRVDNLPTGLYLLVRDPGQTEALQKAMTEANPWQKPLGCPEQLPLYCLIETDTRAAAKAISCHQDIASDGCFSLAMIAEFTDPLLKQGPWFYPRLYWEAGMIGQLLYLEAEAAGVRGTGIGCFFDDAMHEVLGLKDQQFQDLYHFTIGGAVEDTRLTTLPAYPID